MYYIYLLTDDLGNTYLGYTADLKRRFLEHQHGSNDSTRHFENIRVFYYEAYAEKKVALQRERKLKCFGSAYHGLLKRIGLK